MKKLVTILLLTLLLPATSFAAYETASKLLAECEDDSATCLAYIGGISDTHETYVAWDYMNLGPAFCNPLRVTIGQLKKIVVKYLNDHPEDLHYSASGRVTNALYLAFPPSLKDDGTSYCPDKGES